MARDGRRDRRRPRRRQGPAWSVTGAAVVTSADDGGVVEVDAGIDVAVDADGWLPPLLQAARIITAKPARTA